MQIINDTEHGGSLPSCILDSHLHSLLQVWVSVNPIYCSDRSAEYHRQLWLSGGPPQLQDLLWHGPPGYGGSGSNVLDLLQPPELGGLEAVRPLTGWSHIHIPGECYMCVFSYVNLYLFGLSQKIFHSSGYLVSPDFVIFSY